MDADAAEKLDTWFRGGLAMVLIELGRRTGVLRTMGRSRWRAPALARAASVNERYLLEWLCAMASFEIVTLDIDEECGYWSLAGEFATYLDEAAPAPLLSHATTVTGAAKQMDKLIEPFRNGGGLTYAQRDATLSEAFAEDARVNYRGRLVDNTLPVVPGLLQRLRSGAVMADLGCGAGHGLEVLARAFPAARFVGFDADAHLIHAGQSRLDARGIRNVEMRAKPIEEISAGASFDIVSAFEMIHNLPDPLAALTRARKLLRDDGVFFMYETNASSDRAADIRLPWAGPIYSMSLLSCLTVSLAHDGAGLGAMWGLSTAERTMTDAGFEQVGHAEVIGDPMHVVIWGRLHA